MMGADRARITADWLVDDTVKRYPTTGQLFVQEGRLYVAGAGELYPSYPPMTIRDFAALNRIAVDPLLKRLNAAAEGEEMARREASAAAERAQSGWRERLPRIGNVGYTGGYRDPAMGVVEIPVVWTLEGRGPS